MDYSREINLLTSLGFEIYDPNNEWHWNPEIPIEEGELLFIDPDRSRQRLYVKLCESVNDDVESLVYVLEDIGCGSLLMPFTWSELNADWLIHLKMAFELHGFKKPVESDEAIICQVNTSIGELKGQGLDIGRISDGYHTFDELYEHRIVNFMTICRLVFDTTSNSVWRSKKHSDGSSFDGWFILGINNGAGKQITYHLPMSKWNECAEYTHTMDMAPEWDGHTSNDVLDRLKQL